MMQGCALSRLRSSLTVHLTESRSSLVSPLLRTYSIPPCFKKGPHPLPIASSPLDSPLNNPDFVIPSTIRSILPSNSASIPFDELTPEMLGKAAAAIALEIDALSNQLEGHEAAKSFMDPGSKGLQMTVNAVIMVSGLLDRAKRCANSLDVLMVCANKAPSQRAIDASVKHAWNVLAPFYRSGSGFFFDFEPPYYFL
ncbi:hypothetical protein BC830DRAFT_1117223 [Chytriomyces sp. MP71]|nr:hypothetical protein BC830DRAFT_1117223 [Chytriomyces sp. MP71]